MAILGNVRFGSKADIGAGVKDVRFTPESGHAGKIATAASGHLLFASHDLHRTLRKFSSATEI
jgi:hypothetical protein